MLLALKNIGKIEKAEVKLDGITVIAGENNTGKSTVGKVLYSVFNSFYKINDKIYNEKLENIERAIDNYIYSSMNIRMYRTINLDVISNEILKNADKYIDKLEMIKQEIIDYRSQLEENLDKNADIGNIDELIIKINSILKLSNEDIIRTILKNKINMEFNGQINNIYLEQEGSIGLTIKDKPVLITINDDNVDYISDKFDLNTEAIYIDDPFVLDEQKSRIILNSRFVNR